MHNLCSEWKMRSNYTTIEITKETHKRLKLYAVKHGFQISQIGDKIIRGFLDNEERKNSNRIDEKIETMDT
jgi:hypothetical protein